MRIIFWGDIMGRAGRRALEKYGSEVHEHYRPDIVIANGENAAGGFGMTAKVETELRNLGIDLFTSGNHIWDKKEFAERLGEHERVLRPANYPPGAPGRGWDIFRTASNEPLAVVNLIGRTFMGSYDCPFRAIDDILERIADRACHILVDFHAEATSEKAAMFGYLRGRVSVVLGTHTHVQTADERILDGTASITDAGMCGGQSGIIGMVYDSVIRRYLQAIPSRFEVDMQDLALRGLYVETDDAGRAIAVQRLHVHRDRRI